MKNTSILAIALSLASITALADTAKQPKLHTLQSELQYVQPYGPKGPAFGFVEGKFGDKDPASFFIKMPAGADSGWHFHDEEYKAIVLAGKFTEQQQGDAAETLLPTGTYFRQPGKAVHRNGCAKGADCIVYVHFDRGASSTPTARDGKVK